MSEEDGGPAAAPQMLLEPVALPLPISQPGGQLFSEKRASCRVNATFYGQGYQDFNGGEAADRLKCLTSLPLSGVTSTLKFQFYKFPGTLSPFPALYRQRSEEEARRAGARQKLLH